MSDDIRTASKVTREAFNAAKGTPVGAEWINFVEAQYDLIEALLHEVCASYAARDRLADEVQEFRAKVEAILTKYATEGRVT